MDIKEIKRFLNNLENILVDKSIDSNTRLTIIEREYIHLCETGGCQDEEPTKSFIYVTNETNLKTGDTQLYDVSVIPSDIPLTLSKVGYETLEIDNWVSHYQKGFKYEIYKWETNQILV